MWPFNIRFLPPPVPVQRSTTFARPSSISCQVTLSPSCCSAPCTYCAICSSSPVGLGILMTSQLMATISSSRTSARIRSTSLGSSESGCRFVGVCKVLGSRFSVLSDEPPDENHQGTYTSSRCPFPLSGNCLPVVYRTLLPTDFHVQC